MEKLRGAGEPAPLNLMSENVNQKKGLVLCTFGKGKGKTTSAMGTAIRASGAGLNVYVLQFVKARQREGGRREPGEWQLSSEIKYLNASRTPRNCGEIVTEQLGLGFVGILGDRKQKNEHIKSAIDGLARATHIILSGKYELVVLDEILTAVELGLLTEDDVVELIKKKPESVNLFLTGHDKHPKVFKLCDTITEMKPTKHAYYKGVLARRGIDY